MLYAHGRGAVAAGQGQRMHLEPEAGGPVGARRRPCGAERVQPHEVLDDDPVAAEEGRVGRKVGLTGEPGGIRTEHVHP